MWLIETNDAGGQPLKLNFERWRDHWGNSQEVDTRQDGVVWKTDWSATEVGKFTPSELQLDTSVEPGKNPAATGATDGTAVGVDVSPPARSLADHGHPVGDS